MRLPWSKVYRAFPELDDFEDEQCERFVQWARSRVWLRMVVLPIVAASVWAALVIIATTLAVNTLPALQDGGWFNFFALLLSALALAWSIGVAFLMRDFLLIRAIRSRIRGGRCPQCRFSLLGLPVRDGAITCPECGTLLPLRELGLTQRDLLVEEA